MKSNPAKCPLWISKKIQLKGGIISFREYMDLVLNDPENGFYAKGVAKIGKNGDFTTSPSISKDFCELLASQVEEWVKQIYKECKYVSRISIIEFGPGEGNLLLGIYLFFLKNNKSILEKIDFYVVEINEGMIKKQKNSFCNYPEFKVNWVTINYLKENRIDGLIIAHEVLDAFPVERIQLFNGKLMRQCIRYDESNNELSLFNKELDNSLLASIDNIKQTLSIKIPPENAPNGWTTEWNPYQNEWLNEISKIINNGLLLIIDYMHKADNYFSINRSDGTLLCYRDNKISYSFLENPGEWDLTSHLCEDILINDAKMNDFHLIGNVKQGQALLALGLAERIANLRSMKSKSLEFLLNEREIMLRLIDPNYLGNFKWLCFKNNGQNISEYQFKSRCFLEKI